MTDLVAVLAQLKQERDRLNRAIEALSGLVGPSRARAIVATSGRRTLSAAARTKIADAQRARWAKVKANGAKKAT